MPRIVSKKYLSNCFVCKILKKTHDGYSRIIGEYFDNNFKELNDKEKGAIKNKQLRDEILRAALNMKSVKDNGISITPNPNLIEILGKFAFEEDWNEDLKNKHVLDKPDHALLAPSKEENVKLHDGIYYGYWALKDDTEHKILFFLFDVKNRRIRIRIKNKVITGKVSYGNANFSLLINGSDDKLVPEFILGRGCNNKDIKLAIATWIDSNSRVNTSACIFVFNSKSEFKIDDIEISEEKFKMSFDAFLENCYDAKIFLRNHRDKHIQF